jgi:hypothetical protein
MKSIGRWNIYKDLKSDLGKVHIQYGVDAEDVDGYFLTTTLYSAEAFATRLHKLDMIKEALS